MSFSLDFSQDKPDIREPIPAGTPVFVQMTYTPGGVGPDGALTQSQTGDTQYMKAEFTVLRGPYRGRKFWSNLTFVGGKLDEKGRSIAAGITRQTVRMILDSSQGLKSTDDSPEAAAKRVLTTLKDLQGRKFIAKTKVEPAQNGYPAKNGLGQVLTVDMKTYPSDTELDAPVVAGATSSAKVAETPAWAPNPAVDDPAAVREAAAIAGASAPVPVNQQGAVPAWAA